MKTIPKIAFVMCLIFAIILVVCSITRSTRMFPSKGLEAVIREQINRPDGDITPEDCMGTTELDLSNSDWNTDLEGIQYFVNLERLVCNAGQISDISALSGLTKLRTLSLRQNKIKNLIPLSGLASLEMLDLTDNKIKDVSPLSSLLNLKRLLIGQNPVDDVKSKPIIDTNFFEYVVPDSFIHLAHLEGLQIGALGDYSITVKDGAFIDSNMLPRKKANYEEPELVGN
jgi:Leucine-rich repeat (LRR) protein